MPAKSTSAVAVTLTTKTDLTTYPKTYIRNAFQTSAYLYHTIPAERDSLDVSLSSLGFARSWKLDRNNGDPPAELSIISFPRGLVVSHHLSNTLRLDPNSTRKWKFEHVGFNTYRISGNSPEIQGKYWTYSDADGETVKLEAPVANSAKEADKLKQQWVFEVVPFA